MKGASSLAAFVLPRSSGARYERSAASYNIAASIGTTTSCSPSTLPPLGSSSVGASSPYDHSIHPTRKNEKKKTWPGNKWCAVSDHPHARVVVILILYPCYT